MLISSEVGIIQLKMFPLKLEGHMSTLIQTLSTAPRWGKIMISGAMLGAIGYLAVVVAITITTPAPEGTGLYEYLWSLPLHPFGLLMQAGTYGCGLIGLVAGVLLTADR